MPDIFAYNTGLYVHVAEYACLKCERPCHHPPLHTCTDVYDSPEQHSFFNNSLFDETHNASSVWQPITCLPVGNKGTMPRLRHKWRGNPGKPAEPVQWVVIEKN